MRRIDNGVIRHDWQRIITDQGLEYWPTTLPDGTVRSYWREGPYYSFTNDEIDQMYVDAQTLFEMFVMAGDFILAHPEIMRKMHIPDWAVPMIKGSWDKFDKTGHEVEWGSVYGRIDVRYGGNQFLDMTSHDNVDWMDEGLRRIQLYEFNADTPTSLLEAAIVQWTWFQDTKQGDDQWNGIFEMLVDAWKRNLGYVETLLGYKPTVYFVCTWDDNLLADLAHLHPQFGMTDLKVGENSFEDLQNLRVLEETCREAGYSTQWRYIQEVEKGEDGRFYDGRFTDGTRHHLDVVFKLHPWEFMVNEPNGQAAFEDMADFGKPSAPGVQDTLGTLWIEPPYKMLWSNKGILPVLWRLFGSDPEKSQLLIPAWFEGEQPKELSSFIRKPLLGREGASVQIVQNGRVTLKTPGDYGKEGYVIQAYAPPAEMVGYNEIVHPTLGIWYIDGEPAGLGIRESETAVADNLSYFVPHVIVNNPKIEKGENGS